MALDLHVLVQRLRSARELQSLEINAVSQATGITDNRLNQIESAESKPSGAKTFISIPNGLNT